jgi:hypothetical protein
MFKKKEEVVVTHDSQILDAQDSFAAAVNMFEVAREKVKASNTKLASTDLDIEVEIQALLAKQALIKEQQDRNIKFDLKLEEFLT